MPSAVFLAVFLPATAFSLVVEVSPKQAMFRIGDRETVRCAVKDCAQTPSFSWISLEDRPLYADIQNRGSESVITYLSVESHHENTLQCKVACGGQLKQGKVTIKVFAFPEAPVISGHEHLVLGELATLRCEASPVYPAQLTEIEWWEGGPEPVKSEEGLPNSRALNSSFLFSAREKDDGRNITCRVRHHWLREVIQATVTLAVLRAPGEVQVSGPEEVQLGDALSLRCAAEGKPRPQFQWRVQRPSGLWVVLQGGQELVIRNASHSHTGQYQCLASNELGQRGASLHVSVQGPPRNTSVTLSPPQPIREGESVTLSCRTLSVPEGRLRLLHVSEGEEAELRSLEGSEISVTLPAVQLSHAGLYRCEASNRYGTHSNTTQLTVTGYPLSLELLPVGVVTAEIGSTLSLVCVASGCPLPQFSWAVPAAAEGAVRTTSNHTHSALSLRADNGTQEGTYTCHAHCGSASASLHTQLVLFSFPGVPLIERSGSLLEGENSTFRCVLRDAYPPEAFHIHWLYGDQELPTQMSTETGPGLQCSVSMTMEPSLRGRTLTCGAELMMEGVPSERRRSSAGIIIDVHHPPRNTSVTLSPPQPVREGESVTLSCRTLSVPEGRLRLLRVSEGEEAELRSLEGSEISVTLPAVQLSHAGLYRCEASNRYGTHSNTTQLTVTAPPRNTTVEVFPSQWVAEGDNVTICCRSVSFPPPVVTLTKLGNVTELLSHSGTFHLTNLTASDAGDYQVNVTNHLGFHTQVFTLSVMERSGEPPRNWEELLIPAVVMGTTLASAALLLDFVCRSRRRGFYELAKGDPNPA